jgi:hypothetical protein
MTKKEFAKQLEYLRRRLYGHSKVNYPVGNAIDIQPHNKSVTMDYVDARIDDLISTYGI